jgi:hypothetical protein
VEYESVVLTPGVIEYVEESNTIVRIFESVVTAMSATIYTE